MTLAVVVNSRARAVKKDPALPGALRQQLGDRGTLFVTASTDELPSLAARLIADGVDTVALVGGDGSSAMLTALDTATPAGRRLPRIALLRGGTVNTIASNFGLRGSPRALLARLLATPDRATLPVAPTETIRVNGQLGFLFGAAMGGRFIEVYNEANPTNALQAVAMSARTAASIFVWGKLARRLFAETPLRLDVDGVRTSITRPRLLVASTVPDMGVGFRVAWQAGTRPGHFHLVASELSTLSFGMQIPRVLRALPLNGGPHLDKLATRATIVFASPEPYTLDGELYRTERVELVAGPRFDVLRL